MEWAMLQESHCIHMYNIYYVLYKFITITEHWTYGLKNNLIC